MLVKPHARGPAVLAHIVEVLEQHMVRIVAHAKLSGADAAKRKVMEAQYQTLHKCALEVKPKQIALTNEEN